MYLMLGPRKRQNKFEAFIFLFLFLEEVEVLIVGNCRLLIYKKSDFLRYLFLQKYTLISVNCPYIFSVKRFGFF